MPHSERIADRQERITNLEFIAVAINGGGQILGINLEDGDVGRRVGPDDFGVILFLCRGQCDFHAFGPFDDVVRREDIAVRSNDRPGAEPLGFLFSRRELAKAVSEKLAENGIIQKWVRGLPFADDHR